MDSNMTMTRQVRRAVTVATTFLLLFCGVSHATEVTVHSIIGNPKSFDHQAITLEGTSVAVKETTSQRGNDYTTFKLQDLNGSETVSVFTWGHPTLSSGQCVQVDGVFETEHHQGSYTFYNEVEATKVSPCLSK